MQKQEFKPVPSVPVCIRSSIVIQLVEFLASISSQKSPPTIQIAPAQFFKKPIINELIVYSYVIHFVISRWSIKSGHKFFIFTVIEWKGVNKSSTATIVQSELTQQEAVMSGSKVTV